LSPLYNLTLNKDGSYSFISDDKHVYIIYFLQYKLIDADNNEHKVYSFGFSRNKEHATKSFTYRYDEKIKNTILAVINNFFAENDDKALLYFCYGDDGFARHRSITFKKWGREVANSIESYSTRIAYFEDYIYGCLMVQKDNPLKKLIIDAFEQNIREITSHGG